MASDNTGSSSSLAEGLNRLLDSGKYSDLTLVCQGREFRVHKSIVCTQSLMIERMMDSKFQEAKNGIINVRQFDVDTLECMLDFLYKGSYDVSGMVHTYISQLTKLDVTELALRLESLKISRDGNGSSLPSPSVSPRSTPTMADMILPHVYVNSIAEYYGVPRLQDQANDHIRKLIDVKWESAGFCHLVQIAFDSTNDAVLFDILNKAVAEHIEELVSDDFFMDMDLLNYFSSGVITRMAEKNSEMKAQMEEQIAAEKARMTKKMDDERERLTMRINDLKSRLEAAERPAENKAELANLLSKHRVTEPIARNKRVIASPFRGEPRPFINKRSFPEFDEDYDDYE